MKFRFSLTGVLVFLLPLVTHSQAPPIRIAVIGGGMAGVSAAHYIHAFDPNASVTIFEKEKTLGGNAKTVTVTNADNETVSVDAGPQYFTEGPWDEYIQFLKTYDQYKPDEISEFSGSILIQNKSLERPRLVTPLNGSLRGENLAKLLQFKLFFDEAYKIYRNRKTCAASVGEWVKELKLEEPFKREIVLPFLAASLGTTVGDIKKTSTVEIIKLFAFRKPSPKNTFKVMHRGMGTLIQNIGLALERGGVRVLTQSPVQKVAYGNGIYAVSYQKGKELIQESFNFVVMAVHANQAFKILKNDSAFNNISHILQQFEYFQARIVLHKDSSLVNMKKPAFLNVITGADNQIVANTMNLGMIGKRYRGIYKSWLTEDLCAQIKANGSFLHEEVFYHPLITPQFNASLSSLNKAVAAQRGIFLGGGWTQGLETQETAVVSGKKAMERYREFKGGLTAKP